LARFIAAIPKIVVSLLLVAATDYMDWDPVRFTWVEEVGEMMLAYLTLIGAAIGLRERAHFTLHILRFKPAGQLFVDRVHYLLIGGIGAIAAWYGVKLCLLNRTLTTPGLEINLAVLYASVVVGGVLLAVYAVSMIVAPPPIDPDKAH